MNYEILGSWRFEPEHPIIRLPDGQVISQDGTHFFDLDYYDFQVADLPVPPDHALRCEMVYQNWQESLEYEITEEFVTGLLSVLYPIGTKVRFKAMDVNEEMCHMGEAGSPELSHTISKEMFFQHTKVN